MYDFKSLSPADFEELTRDLLQAQWGIVLESFKAGRDDGIDLRYARSAKQNIIVQCKHYANSSIAKLLSHLNGIELAKVRRLCPNRYVIVTSLPLNPHDKDTILRTMTPFIKSPADIYGSNDINNLIGLFPDLEKKHFKLWLGSTEVLERVLYNAERVQTEYNIERVGKLIPLYVQNKNYPMALDILNKLKAVIISGAPGIG